eukprot:scaffold109546_cov46-Cyclotella_meneghiniana.AAC.2
MPSSASTSAPPTMSSGGSSLFSNSSSSILSDEAEINNATTSSSIPYSSSLFEEHSNRDEFNQFFNVDDLLAMELTLRPNTPTPTSIPTYNLPSYTPTHYQKYGGSGSSWNWNNDDYTTGISEEQENFPEFIAFVSWYAILLLCCFIPTSRIEELDRLGRSNNGVGGVMILDGDDNNNNNQQQHFGPSEILDLGENRNRDWGFLEALFSEGDIIADNNNGTTASTTNGNQSQQRSRRRTALADILSGMSVRMLIEREERRRRERGSRLLAALKETSMEVKLCHLILEEPLCLVGSDDNDNCIIHNEDEATEQISSGMDAEDKSSDDEQKCVAENNDAIDQKENSISEDDVSPNNDKSGESCIEESSVIATAHSDNSECQSSDVKNNPTTTLHDDTNLASDASSLEQKQQQHNIPQSREEENQPISTEQQHCSFNDTDPIRLEEGRASLNVICLEDRQPETMPQSSEKINPSMLTEEEVDSTVPPENIDPICLEEGRAPLNASSVEVDRAQPETMPQSREVVESPISSEQEVGVTIPNSLYEVDDPYMDDDECPYSALCIPCTDYHESATSSTTATINNASPQSPVIFNETRLAPPTCAICLIHYQPGCYVTWS